LLNKIEECSVFIADLSPISRKIDGGSGRQKLLPNPNVVFETGYAFAKLAASQIIAVVNESSLGDAKLDDMPFDIRARRPLVFRLAEDANAVAELPPFTGKWKHALRLALESGPRDRLLRFLRDTNPALIEQHDRGTRELRAMVSQHRAAELWALALSPAMRRIATIASTGSTSSGNTNHIRGHVNDLSPGPAQGLVIRFLDE
jgi:hypothetical protein